MSSEAQYVLRILQKLNSADMPLPSRGDNGTSRELSASAVHQVSSIADKRLVPVDVRLGACSFLLEVPSIHPSC